MTIRDGAEIRHIIGSCLSTCLVMFLKISFEFFLDEKKKERKRARGISPIVFDRSGSSASESYAGILILLLLVVTAD